MKTIIFIGTNKSGSSREAIKAAEQLGYFTVLFTKNEKQIQQRKVYKDVHAMIFVDTNNYGSMKNEINKLKQRGHEILTIVSFLDSYVHIASQLCDEYCINYTSSRAIEIMENKEETRSFLKDQSYTPKFSIINPGDSLDSVSEKMTFPVIVKFPKSTGSKDVLFAANKDEFIRHTKNLQEKNPNEAMIAEEYIEGKQYLVEAMIHNNKVMIAGIIEQEIIRGRRFIITGYGILVDPPVYLMSSIEKILNSVVSKFNIVNGTLHLELRSTGSGLKIIEINPRISGGAMNNMLKAAYGFSLVEETLKLFLGETPSLEPKEKNHIYTQYVIVTKKGILERVTGRGRAKKSPGVVEVYIKPKKGTRLTPPLSLGHRYAYVIATGDSMIEAKRNAKKAAKEITFHLNEDT
ncbi:ATP-grasp domain-containing protein [Lederbergia wuyishanensis]|uniref:Biotin carboxylase n=1 Tax=Lederbergia wuyishanensis TaxID=1347903 RepID=A0ABU0D5C1_9BACI|nr:ATP-grasp domain-containing protein [Lederbergia wuyishanensis]MCJ8009852.1 ATP-grasp domain-containing protein [Lederbergia wuyishanensis]MDQ0343611.1 biotin carboxylase [Lederbergia wuyishanensis]